MNFPLAPEQASSVAYQHDVVFYTLLALTVLFTVLVFVLVVVFAVRYRRGTKVNRLRPHHENLPLELTWTIIPTFLGLIMFFFGAKLFIEMRTSPKDAQDIYVIGKQWMWHVQHSNGVRENNTLHVPVGKPVRLTLISQDVIHAFYVPDFRQQIHVVPGRYTTMWFTPTKAGKYPLYCAMYCGTQHSEMGGYVYAMPATEYAEWLKNGGNNVDAMSMEERGERLFKVLACNNCHAAQSNERAPGLAALYGSNRPISGGSSARADEAYLRESILKPYARLTAGYGPTMPEYQGQISEDDVLNLIAYIRSLSTPAGNVQNSIATAEPQKGTVNRFSGARYVTPPGNALGAESRMNAGETNLSETGASVNATAAEHRIDRR